jgi:hypothetical protein
MPINSEGEKELGKEINEEQKELNKKIDERNKIWER